MSLSFEAQMQQEREELAAFVRENRCPSEAETRQWLEGAIEGSKSSDKDLRKMLKGLGLNGVALSYFSYEIFKQLYDAPLAATPEEENVQQQGAGAKLHDRGGLACMRLHYYLVNYAMCGSYFFGPEPRAPGIKGYISEVKYAWTGIGDWLA